MRAGRAGVGLLSALFGWLASPGGGIISGDEAEAAAEHKKMIAEDPELAGLESVTEVEPWDVVGYLQPHRDRRNGSSYTRAWCVEHVSRGRRSRRPMEEVLYWNRAKLSGHGCAHPECCVEWGDEPQDDEAQP